MPCHVDPINARQDKGEIDMIVRVMRGEIKFSRIGDCFSGQYQTLEKIIDRERKKLRAKYGSFQYAANGTTLVIVAPCPKGC